MRTDRLTRAGHAPAIFFIGAGSITCSRRTGLCRCVHLITVSDGCLRHVFGCYGTITTNARRNAKCLELREVT
jgi:hypothetical protein